MPPKKKLKCYTKPKKDGGKYTTCLPNGATQKKIEPEKKPAKKKLPTKLRIVEKKIEPKKKPVKKKKMPTKLNIVESKPKAKAKPKKLRIIAGGRYPALAKKMGIRPISEKDLATIDANSKKRRDEKERKAFPELNAVTGLTQSQANNMTPMALFGLLPKELGKMVLLPSQRGGGVKVARPPLSTDADFKDIFQKMYKLRVKKGNVNSKAAIKDITGMVNSFYKEVFHTTFNLVLTNRIKRGKRYTDLNIFKDLQRQGKLEAGRKILLADFEKAKVNFAAKDVEKAKAKSDSIEYYADEVKRKFEVGNSIIGVGRTIDRDDATRANKFVAGDKFTIVKFNPKGVSIKDKDGKTKQVGFRFFEDRFRKY